MPTEAEHHIYIGGNCSHSDLVAGSFSDLWHLHFPENPTNDDLDRIFMKVEDFKDGKIPVILQPGNSIIKQFVLRAKRSLFFKPITYNFQIQIRYEVDGQENFETVPYNLDIRAALKSTITGGFVGGIVGVVARTLNNDASLTLGTVALAAIFGTVAVVAFARKESAQQIIRIENFWMIY
ncbi:hypothetical protein [Candidatus Albibeggiatoa sp. nov. BB20]|uniref:hypothetical protein n=1 Tax=Candidatus Albibeggiatoa sp. nov. BB20 TaxID=3162723 RepID=UPI0033658D73